MQTTLAALAVITVGYIFAYLIFDRLRDRYGYVGGAEYVVIGFLLGGLTGSPDRRPARTPGNRRVPAAPGTSGGRW